MAARRVEIDEKAASVGRPELVIIAAVAETNRVIGDGFRLPWHIPEDLKRFKRLTRGHPLIMGRKTFQSLLVQFGGPLPERRHLVLTRRPERVDHPVAECFTTLDDALDAVAGEDLVFVAGGASVYALTIASADRLELTIVEGDYHGDAFFPPWEHLVGPVYKLALREAHEGFRYETYIRREDLTLR
ncbi:MAG TPA: dihydrofolate reductase [Rhodothermia bacterium]